MIARSNEKSKLFFIMIKYFRSLKRAFGLYLLYIKITVITLINVL